jgi:citrate lyase beta subunit
MRATEALCARRALLFVPDYDRHKIEKAARLGVECICMDMDDGVALNCKDVVRWTIAAERGELDFGWAEKLVHINPVVSFDLLWFLFCLATKSITEEGPFFTPSL